MCKSSLTNATASRDYLFLALVFIGTMSLANYGKFFEPVVSIIVLALVVHPACLKYISI